jgi:hypothetical protein
MNPSQPNWNARMNQDLKDFMAAYLRVVIMALVPIALTAFLTVPFMLGWHAEEMSVPSRVANAHMT